MFASVKEWIDKERSKAKKQAYQPLKEEEGGEEAAAQDDSAQDKTSANRPPPVATPSDPLLDA